MTATYRINAPVGPIARWLPSLDAAKERYIAATSDAWRFDNDGQPMPVITFEQSTEDEAAHYDRAHGVEDLRVESEEQQGDGGTMKLTIEITQEPSVTDQWVSRCLELDITSAGNDFEISIVAVAEEVRMTLQQEAARHDISCVEAFEKIAREVAARRPHAPMSDVDHDAHGGRYLEPFDRGKR